nr:MAG TPA: hypothetical protein [Caudoviricetes sp.]
MPYGRRGTRARCAVPTWRCRRRRSPGCHGTTP